MPGGSERDAAGCYLLTAGVEPDPQVWALTRAATATGLPILLAPSSTYATAMQVHDLAVDLSADDLDRAEQVMATGADALDGAWLADLLSRPEDRRLSPAAFRFRLTELARAVDARIVLPEGSEPRTLQAATLCAERGIARPVLLAAPQDVQDAARRLGLSLPDTVEVVDLGAVAERYVRPLVERRRAKGWTDEVAREHLADPIMVGTMMLALGEVDGLVAGVVHTTADTVRPALQVLGAAPAARLVSSVFFMCLPDEVFVYGDCAIDPQPTAEELADIALRCAASARAFGIEPRVAMISFSTGTSGVGLDVDKVADATRRVRERAAGPGRRRPAAVRRRHDPVRRAEQAAWQRGRVPGQRLRLPGPRHRQHDLQGGAAQRRRRQHRSEAAGPGQAP